MAKRELSSTLKNLKFMQRAALREEKSKKEEEDEVKSDVNTFGTPTISRKCIVIMEGDPHPRATKGRMSFQSFNPRIDRLNEDDSRLHRPAAETSSSRNQSGNISIRRCTHQIALNPAAAQRGISESAVMNLHATDAVYPRVSFCHFPPPFLASASSSIIEWAEGRRREERELRIMAAMVRV